MGELGGLTSLAWHNSDNPDAITPTQLLYLGAKGFKRHAGTLRKNTQGTMVKCDIEPIFAVT